MNLIIADHAEGTMPHVMMLTVAAAVVGIDLENTCALIAGGAAGVIL